MRRARTWGAIALALALVLGFASRGAAAETFDPAQADAIIRDGRADLVMLAHAMLDDPNWPFHAAKALNIPDAKWTLPAPYAHWIRA